MRENRTCGSEGGEAQSLPYPYHLGGAPSYQFTTTNYQLSIIKCWLWIDG